MARSGLGIVAVKVCGTLLTFLSGVILARVLGASGYGVYSYALSVATLLVVVAALGLPQLLVREIAAGTAEDAWAGIRGLLLRSEQAVLAASLTIVVAIAGMIQFFPGWPEGELATTLLWSLGLTPILALSEIRSGALRGFRRVVKGLVPGIVVRPAALILFLSLAYFGIGRSLHPAMAMGLHAAAGGISLLIATWWLFRALPPNGKSGRLTRLGASPGAAAPFLLLGLVQTINGQVDILMMGTLRPVEELGVYRVAVGVGTLVPFFLGAMGVVIEPEVSNLFSTGDRSTLKRLVTTYARWVLAVTAPLVLVLLLFGGEVLRIVYGSEFEAGYFPLVILVAGQFFNVSMGPVMLILNMTGLQRESLKGVSIAAGINMTVSAALVPKFGAIGAALANTATLVTWNGYLVHRLRVRLGIDSTALGWNRSR